MVSEEIFKEFQTVSLDEVLRAALTERMEKKFIFHEKFLPDLLRLLITDYNLLVVGEHPAQFYESVYLDTSDLQTYLDHHNGRGNRYKIRIRKYHSTADCFLEVKHRIPTGQVKKKRMGISNPDIPIVNEFADFLALHTPYEPSRLMEQIRSYYHRITLVHKTLNERITFDYGLTFRQGEKTIRLSPLVIAECKYDKAQRKPSCLGILKSFHLNPASVSKYCLGIAYTNNNIKKNRFKTKIRKIERLRNERA